MRQSEFKVCCNCTTLSRHASRVTHDCSPLQWGNTRYAIRFPCPANHPLTRSAVGTAQVNIFHLAITTKPLRLLLTTRVLPPVLPPRNRHNQAKPQMMVPNSRSTIPSNLTKPLDSKLSSSVMPLSTNSTGENYHKVMPLSLLSRLSLEPPILEPEMTPLSNTTDLSLGPCFQTCLQTC